MAEKTVLMPDTQEIATQLSLRRRHEAVLRVLHRACAKPDDIEK